MVEEDPDEETYYEMGGSSSNIPVRYKLAIVLTQSGTAFYTTTYTLHKIKHT